jgi:hypothetical protein
MLIWGVGLVNAVAVLGVVFGTEVYTHCPPGQTWAGVDVRCEISNGTNHTRHHTSMEHGLWGRFSNSRGGIPLLEFGPASA